MEEAFNLKIGDKVDHRDTVGRFLFATVIEKKGTNLKIHYDGWSRKWDTWCDFSKEIHRFAVVHSISRRQSYRVDNLKVEDYVDINPRLRHPGWRKGAIRRLGKRSGQVQVIYEELNTKYLYWTHSDNEAEIAEFGSIAKAEALVSGYIREGDSRVPMDLISICLTYHGSFWMFNNDQECPQEKDKSDNVHSDELRSSQREQIINALNANHEQLQSLLMSLDDAAIAKLSDNATMIHIQNNHDHTMQLIRSCMVHETDVVNASSTSD